MARGMGGAVAFCVTNEVTGLITAQERLARENKRLIALFEKSPLFIAFFASNEPSPATPAA